MRTELLLVSLALTACSTAPAPGAPVIDEQCMTVAKYARSVVHLREIGVTRAEISAYSSTPVMLTFPLQEVQHDVYSRGGELNAGSIAQEYYDFCVRDGYPNLLRTLNVRASARVDAEREQNVLVLSTELSAPKAPPKKAPRRTPKPAK